MEQKNRPAGKRELFLAGAVLLAALLIFILNQAVHSRPAAFLEISVDGTVIQTLDLHKDQEYTVENGAGGVNRFMIRGGRAWVTEASCPNKICMDQGQVSQDGEMIVCLPNRMTARVMGAP